MFLNKYFTLEINVLFRKGKYMSVTGIGSTYTYIYNYETKKLSSKNGEEDAFVNYFNGVATDDDLKTLNGYDYSIRGDIQTMMEEEFLRNEFRNNGIISDDASEYEIFVNLKSVEETIYSINGKEVFGAMNSMLYTQEEIREFSDLGQPYRTHTPKKYNPADNSINIAVGNVYDFGNGYRVTVLEDLMWGEGFGNGSSDDDRKMNQFIDGFNCLMRVADQITFSSTILKSTTPMLLSFLRSLGIDTSREFIINGTHLNVEDGEIREVNNISGVPNSYYQKAVKRYEEHMEVSLYDFFNKQKNYEWK